MITKEFQLGEKKKILMQAPVEFKGSKSIGFQKMYLEDGEWKFAKGGFLIPIDEAAEFADTAIEFLTEVKGAI
jgi:hypothetical protein